MSTTPNTPGRDTTVRDKLNVVLQDEFSISESGYGIEQLEDALDRLEQIVIAEKRLLLERLQYRINTMVESELLGHDLERAKEAVEIAVSEELKAALQGDTGALHE